MGRRMKVTPAMRRKIMDLYKEIGNFAEVARRTGFDENTIRRYVKNSTSKIRRKLVKTPPKVTPRLRRLIVRTVLRKRRCSIRNIESELNHIVSKSTIANILKENGIRKRKAKRRTFLTQRQKQERKQFAIRFIEEKRSWDKIIWTDEKKFRIDGPDSYNKYWVPVDKEHVTDVQSKDYQRYKGVMIWMAISSKGVIHFERVTGTMNADRYFEVVFANALPRIHAEHGIDFVFQQDNATCHKEKSIMDAFTEHGIDVMAWPPCSPDLSPIENVWSIIASRVYKDKACFESEESLWKIISAEIRKLTATELHPLVKSIGRRLIALAECNYGVIDKW